jgi:hypothetical protein
MNIEPGKYYRTSDGRKVGPMRHDFGSIWDCKECFPDDGDYHWHDNGRRGGAARPDCPDLIAEWDPTPEPAKGGLPDWMGFLDIDGLDVEVRGGDGRVYLSVEVDGRMATSELPPERARALATALTAYADQAEAAK